MAKVSFVHFISTFNKSTPSFGQRIPPLITLPSNLLQPIEYMYIFVGCSIFHGSILLAD